MGRRKPIPPVGRSPLHPTSKVRAKARSRSEWAPSEEIRPEAERSLLSLSGEMADVTLERIADSLTSAPTVEGSTLWSSAASQERESRRPT